MVYKTKNYGRAATSESKAMDIVCKASSAYTEEFMFSKSGSDSRLLLIGVEALSRVVDGMIELFLGGLSEHLVVTTAHGRSKYHQYTERIPNELKEI